MYMLSPGVPFSKTTSSFLPSISSSSSATSARISSEASANMGTALRQITLSMVSMRAFPSAAARPRSRAAAQTAVSRTSALGSSTAFPSASSHPSPPRRTAACSAQAVVQADTNARGRSAAWRTRSCGVLTSRASVSSMRAEASAGARSSITASTRGLRPASRVTSSTSRA